MVGQSRLGMVGNGGARQGSRGEVGCGVARIGMLRRGGVRQSRLGMVRLGRASIGVVRQSRRGGVGRGTYWYDKARRGSRGEAGWVLARLVGDWLGSQG